MPKVVILGAGVIGLTTAIVLRKNGFDDITIVGKYLPGDDLTHEFTSPWAGASIVSFAFENKLLQDIDLISFQEFERQVKEAPEAGVMHCPGVHYSEIEDPAAEAWAHKLYTNTTSIPKDQLPKGVVFGYKFQSFTMSAPRYLSWLVANVQKLGIAIERGTFEALSQVADHYDGADIVINCTGLGSLFLTDVQDKTVNAIRGQTVLVNAPHIKTQMYREGPDVYTYIIPRPDGNVIVGGTLDYVNKSTVADPAITRDILKRVYELNPELTHGKGPDAFNVVSQNVGFRPGRKDSVRIEKQVRDNHGKKLTVVHNYGHGAHGYQSCWGSAVKVLELLNDGVQLKAKL
ncbi:hypothetical protein BDB00DRAFT_859906 [Zychaea mexicana]|uniref:uncharacterized protein n=1 Tax=Zychaea mexicana TaxID=64656 RepID=UPI0022FF0684|nr:uncharacterized protein BDB00DRAFT_859906 [Zychaea mexicana]KAI9476633.1 hypothetical protein BDB00DRAFT_859906 [Zychaea mexicana]